MWWIISNLVFYEVTYNYKYNGKELQETGMYDYGARFYMPDMVVYQKCWFLLLINVCK
ncbi:hypothetical protein CHRYSEO8AT_790003 [Chryseobacterium sp. 8AT]|nr:hypothetical protein CHRYSEO8AT_790003 [Chryseobacterium sp. 8AT]